MTISTIWLVLLLALAGCKSTPSSVAFQQRARADEILGFLRDNGLSSSLTTAFSTRREDFAGLYSKSGGMGHGWDWYLFEDGVYYEVSRGCTAALVYQGRWVTDGVTLQLTQTCSRPKRGRRIRRSMIILREGKERLPAAKLRLLDITVAYRSIIYEEQNRLLVEQRENALPHVRGKPIFMIYPRERDLKANDKVVLAHKLKYLQELIEKIDMDPSE